jgi:hypothetical protein
VKETEQMEGDSDVVRDILSTHSVWLRMRKNVAIILFLTSFRLVGQNTSP